MTLERGAQVALRATAPWLELPGLLDLLAKAIPKQPSPPHKLRYLQFDPATYRVTLNTPAVIRRMLSDPRFKELTKSAMSGFLNDLSVPEDRSEARIGGRIKPGAEGAFKAAVGALIAAVDAEVAALRERGFDPAGLFHEDPYALMSALAAKQGSRIDFRLSGASRVMPVSFASEPGRTVAERERDLARLFIASETVGLSRAGLLDEFARSYARALQFRDEDEAKVGSQVALLRMEAERADSKVSQFLDFCEDEALSRIRTRVGFMMMRAVLERAKRRTAKHMSLDLIRDYIEAALSIHEAATGDGTGINVELGRWFGIQGEFPFDHQINRAYFYRCLPVWPDWSAQVGEVQPQGDDGVHREIYYRFRINGTSPEAAEGEERLTAYRARLSDIRSRLDTEAGISTTEVANLIFLWSVVPSQDPALAGLSPVERCGRAHDRLRAGGRLAAAELIGELEARSEAMDRIAKGVVELLKYRDDDVLSREDGTALRLYVNLAPGMLDPNRLTGPISQVFAADGGRAHLFENLVVSDRRLEGMFVSYPVDVTVVERSIVPAGEPAALLMDRRLSGRLANIVFQPVRWKSDEVAPEPAFSVDDWQHGPTIRVLYEPRLMGSRVTGSESQQQARAAAQSAFSVLAFVTVKRLLEHAGATRGDRVVATRTQQPVDPGFAFSGEDAVYAASQALEHALGRDIGVRVQGIVVDPDSRTMQYRRRAAVDALASVFPLRMQTATPLAEPSLGVVTFSSRPCDAHSKAIAEEDAGHLILGRAYLATRLPGSRGLLEVSCAGHLLDTHVGRETFARQPVVLETIRRLYEAGTRTVVLIGHRFQGRHVGRAASRHRHFDNPAVLHQIHQDFPGLSLIMLVRNTYPAFRLASVRSGRGDPEFFEIRGHEAHTDRWRKLMSASPASAMHGLIPFYSAATLRVVEAHEDAARPGVLRPQSGFASYSLLSDQSSIPVEWMAQNNLLLTPAGAAMRESVCDVLRGIHYLEAETCRGSFVLDGRKRNVVSPVLDPYQWCNPVRIGGVGEIWARRAESSRRRGSVVLSVPAMLARVLDVYDVEHVGRLPHCPAPGGAHGSAAQAEVP